MKWLIAILAVGTIAVAGAAADDAKEELKKLEGTWEVVSIEASGMKVEFGKGAPEKAVISGGKATFFAQGKEMPTFKDLKLDPDPKKSPKAIDLVRGAKESLPCIYEVTDNELKLAMPLVPLEKKPGETLTRPDSFVTKDKAVIVLIAKRKA